MFTKKHKNKAYGITLTSAEKKAMNAEIARQTAEWDRKHLIEIEALILWELHEQFGFGPKRLKRFYDNFAKDIEKLVDRYCLETSDKVWLCTYKLKEYGIDIEEWHEERGNDHD